MEIFGSTLRETLVAFKPRHLGAEKNATKRDKIIAIGRIIVTILLIFVATFCFVHQEVGSGAGIIGTIVGYWIK